MKKHKNLLFLIISILLYIVHSILLKNQIANIFSNDFINRKNAYLALSISFLFGVLFYYLCILSLYLLLIQKESSFILYFKQFLFYFIPLMILLILAWPGIFKGDEFYVLHAVRDYTYSSAQTGLTSIFYICCLRFFPSMAAIPFFQIIIISVIYAYIFKNLTDIYQSKLILCRIIFFLFPVLDGALFTLRATLVGFIFLFITAFCFIIWKKNNYSMNKIILLSILTGLVIAWRSEYIYMLILLPLYFAFILWKEKDKKNILISICLCCFIIIISRSVFNIPNKMALNGSNKYPISLVINPLGNIFAQDNIRGKNAYEDIMTINELIDVQALRIHPSVRNISQYWNIPDQLPKDQLDRFMNASYDLILHNFDTFLYYRWLTFKYTNGMVANDINHPTAPTAETIYTLNYYDEDYQNLYYYSKPLLGVTVRTKIIDLLSCRHYENDNSKTNHLYPIMYNCLPTFILAFLIMLICICSKKYTMAFILFMTGAQLPLIFLTAPAMFFMYYFCFYLTGYFFSALTYYEIKYHN